MSPLGESSHVLSRPSTGDGTATFGSPGEGGPPTAWRARAFREGGTMR